MFTIRSNDLDSIRVETLLVDVGLRRLGQERVALQVVDELAHALIRDQDESSVAYELERQVANHDLLLHFRLQIDRLGFGEKRAIDRRVRIDFLIIFGSFLMSVISFIIDIL